MSLGCAPPSILAIVLLRGKLRETRRVDAKWNLELCKRDVNLLTRHLDLWIRDFDLRTLEKRHERSTSSTYSRTDLCRLVETHEPNLLTDVIDIFNLRQRAISMGQRPRYMGKRLRCIGTRHKRSTYSRTDLSRPMRPIYTQTQETYPPKNGEITLWPYTRIVKCKFYVSQKQNGFNTKNQRYNIYSILYFYSRLGFRLK